MGRQIVQQLFMSPRVLGVTAGILVLLGLIPGMPHLVFLSMGGLLGYAIGVWLEPLGQTILRVFGHPEGQAEFQKWFDQWGLAVFLIKGATPNPYKLVTITAGLARFDLFTFVWASVLTRGFRFFAVAAILKYFGPAMLQEFERRLNLYSVLLLILLVGGIVAIKVFL